MKSAFELPINHLNELPGIAKFILNFAGESRHLLFYAPMGAGKTTLIKELCKALGSEDRFSSPTYAIANEYIFEKGKIFHFDLYRLNSEAELLNLGIEEYLDANNYCFFEWPEKAEAFVSNNYVKIEIEVHKNNRYLRATKF
jgi:tRNA threonylcarbamoyladenosine biosynthesis protein TsaE